MYQLLIAEVFLLSSKQPEWKNRIFRMQLEEQALSVALSLNTLHGLLPKTTLAEFQELDEKASVSMAKYINCAECYKPAISKVLNFIMAKSVQMEYSSCGRAMEGVKKLNFSATSIFKLMNSKKSKLSTLIVEKFTILEETILSRTSRWLSGATDREGGRTVRMLNSLQNHNV
ncbi:hypothetical protein TSAR_014175 [Trichomalopsis sarcophagae]|uniref:DUF4806 domain-containing protein n=1 Tax=Trichomalopsis sarcophagae TaxID=543379 RepID=A0A232EX55_9HYME|nr:hypothetical protein TSAR_014175 [Trichomalopsis sarcophagae]